MILLDDIDLTFDDRRVRTDVRVVLPPKTGTTALVQALRATYGDRVREHGPHHGFLEPSSPLEPDPEGRLRVGLVRSPVSWTWSWLGHALRSPSCWGWMREMGLGRPDLSSFALATDWPEALLALGQTVRCEVPVIFFEAPGLADRLLNGEGLWQATMNLYAMDAVLRNESLSKDAAELFADMDASSVVELGSLRQIQRRTQGRIQRLREEHPDLSAALLEQSQPLARQLGYE